MADLVITTYFIFSAPVQNIANKVVKGAVPKLTIVNTRIKGNERGIWASFYNRSVYTKFVAYTFNNMLNK